MISAYASTSTAVEAMKWGAYDYLPKPFKVSVYYVAGLYPSTVLPEADPFNFLQHVITSYSIHYTKLYDAGGD